MQLRSLQRRCYRAFMHGHTNALLEHVLGGKLPASARVQIYQNNARETFYKTLAASYPTILALVGEQCFRTLAGEYAQTNPSLSGNLIDYGANFGSLLRARYAGGEFDYLPDVARLDWAMELARNAADAVSFDLQSLAQVPEGQRADLCFTLHPSLQCIESRYPILEIWQLNQHTDPNAQDPIDLASGGEQLLVLRRRNDVQLRPITAAELVFIEALHEGHALGHSAELAMERDTTYEPAATLVLLARLELLVAFFLDPCIHRSSPCPLPSL